MTAKILCLQAPSVDVYFSDGDRSFPAHLKGGFDLLGEFNDDAGRSMQQSCPPQYDRGWLEAALEDQVKTSFAPDAQAISTLNAASVGRDLKD